jgi:hypothetical protein
VHGAPFQVERALHGQQRKGGKFQLVQQEPKHFRWYPCHEIMWEGHEAFVNLDMGMEDRSIGHYFLY